VTLHDHKQMRDMTTAAAESRSRSSSPRSVPFRAVPLGYLREFELFLFLFDVRILAERLHQRFRILTSGCVQFTAHRHSRTGTGEAGGQPPSPEGGPNALAWVCVYFLSGPKFMIVNRFFFHAM
jgi:hypothetical protein